MSVLPNIVYIMADDMGYGDLGCYGATKIPTPNIDRIASQGLRFTDAHSSSAVCTPSRYSVLTGRYCWRTRLKKWVLWGFEDPLLESGQLTIADMLRDQGYATAAVGKWHVGLGWTTSDGLDPLPDGSNIDYAAPISDGPLDHGFDTCFIITGSLDMAPYCFIKDEHTLSIPSLEKYPYYPQQRKGLMVPDWRDDQVDVRFTEKAVAFIEQQAADPETPFFLYLTPSAPHRPCVPPEFMRGKSLAGARGDMVAMVDWMVGQVDEALQRHGVADNTLLIITSDNGARATDYDGKDYGHKSCGNLRGQKADIWDGGHREPLIMRWPARITAGGQCDALVSLVDMMATWAAITDFDLPPEAAPDSYNILPALLGPQIAPGRNTLVHHSGEGMYAVREGSWKMIAGLGSGGFTAPVWIETTPGGPEGQLYNLASDPLEEHNLWATRPDMVAHLMSLLIDYRDRGYTREGAATPPAPITHGPAPYEELKAQSVLPE